MTYNNEQDRTCFLTARTSIPLEEAPCRKMSPPTSAHINIALLALQFAPKGRCISFLNLLKLPGSRASFLRIDGGWSPHGCDHLAIFHIPLRVWVVKVGQPHVSRLLRCHAVLRVYLVFDWCLMYSAFVKRRTPRVRFKIEYLLPGLAKSSNCCSHNMQCSFLSTSTVSFWQRFAHQCDDIVIAALLMHGGATGGNATLNHPKAFCALRQNAK